MSSGSRNSHHRHFRVYCQDGMQEESSSCFSSLPYFFEGHGPFQEPSFVEDPLYDTIYETKWKLLNMEAARIQRETSGAWKPLSSIANRECSQEPLILRSRHKNFSTSSLLNSTSARRIVVRRSGSGFGFTLRHFIVYPPEDDPGEPPPGGGSDNSAPKPLDTIFVKSVRENSTAAEAGLRIGDRILSVNDTSIEGKSFGDVVKLVQDSPEYLYFVVCPQKDDVLQMYYSEIAQNPESNTRVESEVVRWSRESSPFSRNYEHVYAVPARITSTESINAKEEFLRFTPVCLQTRNPSSQDVPKRNPALDELPDTPLIKNNLKSVSTDLHSQEASKISDSDQQNNSRHKTYQDFDSYGQSIEQDNLQRGNPQMIRATSSSSISDFHRDRAKKIPASFKRRGTTPEIHQRKSKRLFGKMDADKLLEARKKLKNEDIEDKCAIEEEDTYEDNPRKSYGVRRKRLSKDGQFALTLLLNESEKSKIVDAIHRAKSVISKKVEKVMGGVKPNKHSSKVTNAEALTAALEDWVTDEESKMRKDELEESSLIDAQERQIVDKINRGERPPVRYKVVKENQENITLNDNNDDMTVHELRPEKETVIRIRPPRLNIAEARNFVEDARHSIMSPTRSLSPCESVPRPFLHVPSMEGYKLQRPSTHYDESSQACSSRPSSRQDYHQYCRPGSYVIPVGGVWRPGNSDEEVDLFSDNEETPKVEEDTSHRRSNTNFVYRNEHTGHREQPSSAVFLEQDQSDTLILDDKCSSKSVIVRVGKNKESSSSNNNNGSSSSVPSTTALLLRNQSTSTNDDAACSQTISAFSSSTVDCMEDPCRFSKPQQQLRRPNTLKLTTTTSIASNHSKQINPRDDDDRYIRRVSYLKATKEVETDSDEEVKNITAEVGQKPSHSIQRLRALFGEKVSNCPSSSPTLLVPSLQSSTSEIRTPSEVHTPTTLSSDGVKEGWLTCKISYICGKKATDRSWKTVYVVLKSHAMYMYKDKKTALESPMSCEEAPLSLSESTVEIAEDYTKRKNVFRIRTETGSVYLFQADGESVMKEWVRAVEETSMSIVIDERKDSSKPSSGFRKLTTSFRNKSPTGFPMPRKPSQDTTTPLSSSNGTLNVGSASSGTSVGSNKSTSTWRGKVVQKWKKIQHGSPSMNGSFGAQATSYPEGGSIGVPLDECPLSQEDNVPLLVKACCSIVEDKGLEIIGVYRVPGNKAAVTQLTEQINSINGEEVILAMEDPRWGDINVVSSLLKLFFRRLPDPLFTLDMYSSFIETSKIEEPIERINRLKKLIRELPEIHYETLKYVSKHLTKVIENSETNKMESRNLAIVFGPTLVRTSDEDMVTVVTDMSHQCRIIESILSNWEWFFNNDEIDCNYENIHFEEPVISDCNSLTTTSKGNETLLINNINKLEYSPGTLKSPVTAKDIVSGIISAANRKMMKSQNRKKETTPTTSQPLPLTTTITRMTGSVNSGISNTSSSTRDSDGGTITIVTASENEVEIPSSRREPIKASPFPFDTYQGLNEATAERIKRFEEETKAMMSLSQQQRITIKTTANSNNDTTHHFVTLTSTAPSSGVKSDAPDNNNAISVYSRTASNTSLAAPSHHDLEGGILLEEPYDTPKGTYDRLPGDCGGGPQDRFLTMTYLSSPTPPEILVRSNKSSSPTLTEYSSSSSNSSSFDTFKIASHGTLKRRILQKSVTENSLRPPFLSAGRRYHSSSNFSQLSSQSNNINEEITEENSVIKDPTLELMSSITANFDEKMRLLLDPHYQLSSSSDTQSVSSTPTKSKFRKKSEVCCDTSSVSASSEMNIIDSTTHKKRTSPKGTGVFSTVQKFESNNDKEHREAYNTEQRNRKSDLRRGRTVDKHKEPNGLRCLKRNDSLSKREKQELNLMKKQFSSSSSRVLKLKEQFEAQCLLQNNQKTVIGKESKLQKTIANNNQRRRVRRRHTVGGTKDFAHLEDFLSRDDQNDLGIEKKDDEEEKENNGRISPVVTEPKSQLRTFLRTHQRLNNSDLIEAEHRRLSLPDSVVLFGSHQSPYSFSCGTSVGSNV